MNEQNLRAFALADDLDLVQAAPDSEVTIAGATGLEPATSGVTGQRSNQLSYAPGRQGRLAPGGHYLRVAGFGAGRCHSGAAWR